MEGYLHFNRINRYIIDHTGARGIGYFYDDHFTYKQKPWSLGHRIYRFFQRRDLKKSVAMCSAFFAISPKTKHECDAFFGIDSALLTKPVTAEGAGWLPYVPGYPLRMLYTGNLLIGRRESISLLGRAMGLVNSDKVRVVLDVYTTTSLSPQEVLSIDPSVRIHQAVSRAEVLELQREADVLLFVEDLLGAERKTARLSFSTKLTEYLACGKCIFAIGDAENSPIEYLRSERAAVCASSSDEILNQLRTLCDTPALVADYGRRAYECGLRNHGERVVRSRLYEVLTSGHTPDMTVCG
jgi:hypothetical protein